MNNKKDIKTYFLSYRKLSDKILLKETELEILKEKNRGITSPKFNDNISKNTSPNGLEDKIIKEQELEEYIKKLYIKKNNLREKYTKDFSKLSKSDYKIILTLYYLDMITIKNISITLNKSIGHIKKMKRLALNELSDILKKNT